MDVVKEIHMSYEEYVNYLLKKYGKSEYDYFCDESCKSRNTKGIRTSEGLFQHHIDEDKAILLSTKECALVQPYEYQKASRLVYCNLLEHLLLHIKIVEEKFSETNFVGMGGAELIFRILNDTYTKNKISKNYDGQCYEVIKENYTDYLLAICYLYNVVRNNKILSKEFSDEDFARGWRGNVIKGIYYDLKDIIPNFGKTI